MDPKQQATAAQAEARKQAGAAWHAVVGAVNQAIALGLALVAWAGLTAIRGLHVREARVVDAMVRLAGELEKERRAAKAIETEALCESR